MKQCILRCLLVPLLGFIFFSCKSGTEEIGEDGAQKSKGRPGTIHKRVRRGGSQEPEGGGGPDDIKEAFKQVLQVLHASYPKDTKDHTKIHEKFFFQIIGTEKAVHVVKKGSDYQVGEGGSAGSGTYTIMGEASTGGNSSGNNKQCKNANNKPPTLSYTYKEYKPKGSDITVNGSITVFDRAGDDTKADGSCEAISNQNKSDKMKTSTLTISGLYKAELKFIVDTGSGHNDIGKYKSNYMKYLAGNESAGFRIEFTYKGNTLKLVGEGKNDHDVKIQPQNLDLLKKLIFVS